MKRVVVLAALLLSASVVSACVTPEQIAQADDATCQSYSYQVGTDAYGQCRMSLSQQREERREAILARLQANQAAYQQQQQAIYQQQMENMRAWGQQNAPSRPVNCTTSYVGNQAYTNCN